MHNIDVVTALALLNGFDNEKLGTSTNVDLYKLWDRSYCSQLPSRFHSHCLAYRRKLRTKFLEATEQSLSQHLLSRIEQSIQTFRGWIIRVTDIRWKTIHRKFSNNRRGHPWRIYLLSTLPKLGLQSKNNGPILRILKIGWDRSQLYCQTGHMVPYLATQRITHGSKCWQFKRWIMLLSSYHISISLLLSKLTCHPFHSLRGCVCSQKMSLRLRSGV